MIANGRGIDLARQIGAERQRFKLGREYETLRQNSVIERFHTQVVAGDRQHTVAPVPDGESEYTIQAFDALQPVTSEKGE